MYALPMTVNLSDFEISTARLAAGMMRIEAMSDNEIRSLYAAAREVGVTYFDHADIYGSFSEGGFMHRCEQRFSDAVALSNSERDEIILQTKAGIHPGLGYDSSYEHLVNSARESLRALKTDYLDVFLIHRPDALVEPDEVARAFDELHSAGDVRYFGVSNHTPAQIEVLRGVVDQPLVVNQIQLSLVHAGPIAQGITANTGADDAASRDLGVLDYARVNGMVVQAWSPLQGPSGTFVGAPEFAELNRVLNELARTYNVSPSAIAIAWISRHPAGIQSVVGTTRPEHLRDLAMSMDVMLTRAEWYRLYTAAGHLLP